MKNGGSGIEKCLSGFKISSEAMENDNSCLITATHYEELIKNPKCFNITPVKDWPSPVNSMYEVPCK